MIFFLKKKYKVYIYEYKNINEEKIENKIVSLFHIPTAEKNECDFQDSNFQEERKFLCAIFCD